MDSQKIIKSLVDEGFRCVGMISEARSKCVMLKERIFQNTICDIDQKIIQINNDINKYSDRLSEVYKELQNYGTFSQLE
jgi:hypothetical protein